MRDKALCSACNCKVNLHTWNLLPRYIPLAVFSNLVDNETKKATTTMLKYPEADFRIGEPELQKYMKVNSAKTHQYNKSWLFFDQPVIGTELTLSRMDSVKYWKEDSSFLTNQPDCFRIGSYQ